MEEIRKLKYLGHIMRRDRYQWLQPILEETIVIKSLAGRHVIETSQHPDIHVAHLCLPDAFMMPFYHFRH